MRRSRTGEAFTIPTFTKNLRASRSGGAKIQKVMEYMESGCQHNLKTNFLKFSIECNFIYICKIINFKNKKMESKKTLIKKSSINNGLIFGLVLITFYIIGFVLNIDPNQNKLFGTINSIISYFIAPIYLIYLSINGFKKLNNNFLTLTDGIKIGIIVCLVGSIVFSLFNIVFDIIFPEYNIEMLNYVKNNIKNENPNIRKDELEFSLKIVKIMMNPIVLLPFLAMLYTFIGFIYGLIMGAIFKNEQNAY
jgi:Protein of unknown function (DUF4199)